jgi:hypothetical protein
MVFKIEKGFDFQEENGNVWRTTIAPTYFQITPQVAWGQGKIPFNVEHRNWNADKQRWENGTVITLDVPFPEIDFEAKIGDIMNSFFAEHPQYQGGELLATTWELSIIN